MGCETGFDEINHRERLVDSDECFFIRCDVAFDKGQMDGQAGFVAINDAMKCPQLPYSGLSPGERLVKS